MQHQEPTEPLPAFGSGIQFVRPSKKARQQGSTAAPVSAVSGVKSVIPQSMDDDDQNNEEDEMPLKKSYPVSGMTFPCFWCNMSETVVASCAGEVVVYLAHAACMMLTWADSQRNTL